jgi:hypothetical protein
MDSTKAKKAVGKAKQAKEIAALMTAQAIADAPINPEIQSPMVTMQPEDGYINPYRPLGTVASVPYSVGNMLGGGNSPMFINPEA